MSTKTVSTTFHSLHQWMKFVKLKFSLTTIQWGAIPEACGKVQVVWQITSPPCQVMIHLLLTTYISTFMLALRSSAASKQKQLKQTLMDGWVHLSHLSPITMCWTTSSSVHNDIQPVPDSFCHTHVLQYIHHHSYAQENKTSLPEWLLPRGTDLCSDEVLWTADQGLHLLFTSQDTTLLLPLQSTYHPNWSTEDTMVHILHTYISHEQERELCEITVHWLQFKF